MAEALRPAEQEGQATLVGRATGLDRCGLHVDLPDPDVRREGVLRAVRLDGKDHPWSPHGGDRILANKVVYDFRDPEQGDVVVFKGPGTWAAEADVPGPSTWFGKALSSVGSVVGIAPPNEKDFVKRVIAVGGQTVACCDVKGNVTVDGKPLNEPYIFEPLPFEPGVADCAVGGLDADHYGSRRCFAPVKVPAGGLWVMGDHRSYSDDSSYNCLQLKPAAAPPTCGRPIPTSDVISKAIFIVAPISRWRTIGNPDIDPQR